jgi:hypothetical protein
MSRLFPGVSFFALMLDGLHDAVLKLKPQRHRREAADVPRQNNLPERPSSAGAGIGRIIQNVDDSDFLPIRRGTGARRESIEVFAAMIAIVTEKNDGARTMGQVLPRDIIHRAQKRERFANQQIGMVDQNDPGC